MSGDTDASYGLLSAQGRKTYPDLQSWVTRANELAPIKGFELSGSTDGKTKAQTTVKVTHEPGLDPFRGLVPAKEVWTVVARKTDAGWLVDADPAVKPEYPPKSKALPAAKEWAEAVQRCDPDAAAKLQAVPEIYGLAASTEATKLCKSTGEVAVVDDGTLPATGQVTTELIAQYSADVTSWAHVVTVAKPAKFSVILAPIGDEWRVVGVFD